MILNCWELGGILIKRNGMLPTTEQNIKHQLTSIISYSSLNLVKILKWDLVDVLYVSRHSQIDFVIHKFEKVILEKKFKN